MYHVAGIILVLEVEQWTKQTENPGLIEIIFYLGKDSQ